MSAQTSFYDAIVVGGGPSGATAASSLARSGYSVALLDKAGRIKPCGGAIPPRAIRDFDIPDHLIVARIKSARMISPSNRTVDMPIEGGFVGMVDREHFDEWLRLRAERDGAALLRGEFQHLAYEADGTVTVHYKQQQPDGSKTTATLAAKSVIGADGARSKVSRQVLPGAERMPCVFAYHEIIQSPDVANDNFDPERCDVYYQGQLSPDFYAWVFPHGSCSSIGVGSAQKGFSLRGAVETLRYANGTDTCSMIRHEGAPIPLKPLKRWDDGRAVLVAGDAAGVVAPASGEGIYYAMLGGQLAGESVAAFLRTGEPAQLKLARKRFMSDHRIVFMILGIMQYFWYCNDRRRERFVSMCEDKDVQRLTWDSYMNKELSRNNPLAHMRIMLKDTAHLLGFVREVPR